MSSRTPDGKSEKRRHRWLPQIADGFHQNPLLDFAQHGTCYRDLQLNRCERAQMGVRTGETLNAMELSRFLTNIWFPAV